MYQFYNFWSQPANQSAILSSSPHTHFLVGTVFTEIEGQSNPTNQPTMQRCVVQILHSSNVTFATLNDDSSHPKRLQKRPIFHHTAAASSTRQHYPGHAGRVAILCALARAAQRYSAHRAYRKHGSSPCASWLIQCEWCNNSQLHEGGKHGVGSNTTGVVPRWRRRRCSGGSPQPSWRATGTKIRVGLIHSCSYYTAYIQTYLLSYRVYGK